MRGATMRERCGGSLPHQIWRQDTTRTLWWEETRVFSRKCGGAWSCWQPYEPHREWPHEVSPCWPMLGGPVLLKVAWVRGDT